MYNHGKNAPRLYILDARTATTDTARQNRLTLATSEQTVVNTSHTPLVVLNPQCVLRFATMYHRILPEEEPADEDASDLMCHLRECASILEPEYNKRIKRGWNPQLKRLGETVTYFQMFHTALIAGKDFGSFTAAHTLTEFKKLKTVATLLPDTQRRQRYTSELQAFTTQFAIMFNLEEHVTSK
jgi:hypothetical protein